VQVLRKGGTLVVSLLCMRVPKQFAPYCAAIAYLTALRASTFRLRNFNHLLWLRLRRKPNWKTRLDQGLKLYWFGEHEAEACSVIPY
jgi:hypothetical protein